MATSKLEIGRRLIRELILIKLMFKQAFDGVARFLSVFSVDLQSQDGTLWRHERKEVETTFTVGLIPAF